MALETTVGARLAINGSAAAIKNLAAFNAELERTNELLAKTKEASIAAVGAVGGVADGAKEKSTAVKNTAAADTEHTAALDAATLAAMKNKKALDELTESHKGLSKSVADLGSGPLGKFGEWATGGAVAVGIESMKHYTQLQQQYVKLFTLAGLPKNQVNKVMTEGINISKQTGVAFSDVANQAYRIQSALAGTHAPATKLVSLMKQAANLAVLFNTPTGAPSELLGRLFGNLGFAGQKNKSGSQLQGVGNAQHITQLLSATVGAGDMQPSDVIGALSKGLTQSGQAVGAKLPDILSWIALSTKLGANASTTGTLISHSLQQIATPSEQGQKSELMFGVQSGDLKSIIQKKGIGAAEQYLVGSIFSGLNTPGYYPAFGKNAPGQASAIAQMQAWGMKPSDIAQVQNHYGLNAQQQAYVAYHGGFAPGETKAQENEQKQMLQFISTKAFGGARQELPWLTIAENPGAYAQVEKLIMGNTNPKTFNAKLQAAYNAPARQFDIAKKNIESYGLQIGKELTPGALAGVKAFVSALKVLANNKGVLIGVATAIGELAAIGLAAKTYSKLRGPVGSVANYVKGVNLRLHGSQINQAAAGLDSSTAEGAAARVQMTAAETQLEAARLNIEGLKGGMVPGGPSSVFPRRAGGAAAGEAEAGVGEASALEEGAVVGGVETAGLDISALAGPIGIAAALAAPIAMPYIIKGIRGLLSSPASTPFKYLNPQESAFVGALSAKQQVNQIINNSTKNSSLTDIVNGSSKPIGGFHYTAPNVTTNTLKNLGNDVNKANKGAWYANVLGSNPKILLSNEEKQLAAAQKGTHSKNPIVAAANAELVGQIKKAISQAQEKVGLQKKSGITQASGGPAYKDLLSASHLAGASVGAGGKAADIAAKHSNDAAVKQGAAALIQKLAGDDTKAAASESKAASKTSGQAAKDHQEAAKELSAAAAALKTAADAVQNIKVNISAQQVAAATNSANANTVGRS